jgi:hypothetical protein
MTNLEYKTHAMPRNGIKCKYAEICMEKNREITPRKLILDNIDKDRSYVGEVPKKMLLSDLHQKVI